MEELLKDYGLPTALLMGISAWCAYLVNFLKGLITSDIATLNEAVQNLSKDIRNTQDDITRIELMIRLIDDYVLFKIPPIWCSKLVEFLTIYRIQKRFFIFLCI